MSVYLTIHNNTPYGNTRLEFHDATRETERIALSSDNDDTAPLIDSTHQQSYKLSKSKHKKSGVRLLVIAGNLAHLHAYSAEFQGINTITVERDGKAILNKMVPIATSSVSLEEYVNGVGILTTHNLAEFLERRLKGAGECIIL